MRYVQIRSAAFANINLRLDGGAVTQWTASGGGTVNCQFGAGRWETYNMLEFVDGSVAFESLAFPNRFLRLDGTGITQETPGGAGTVNAQFGDQSWQHFNVIQNADQTVGLQSSHFPNVFLRMYAPGVNQYLASGSGVANCNYSVDEYTKLVLCECASHDTVMQCVADLANDFPEEQANLLANQRQIAMACCAPFRVDAADLTRLEAMQYSSTSDVEDLPQVDSLTGSGCQQAIVLAAFDAMMFVASLLGFNAKYSERARRAFYQEIGPKLNGFGRLLQDLSEAEGAFNKATMLFKVFRQLMNVGGFKSLYKALKNQMSWWDWVKTCVVFGAQIAVWFASEGIAFIAEGVLLILGAVTLLQDAAAVVTKCGSTGVGDLQTVT